MIAAGVAHAPALALIHAAAFPAAEAWDAPAFAAQLGGPGGFGYLDARGGLVLARVVAEDAEILTIAVASEARRAGLGRALLRAAMHDAARRGAVAAFLEVSVANDGARALYDSCGYEAVGRRRGYYRDGADALVLRAALSRDATAAA